MTDRFVNLMKVGMGRYPTVDVTVDLKCLVDTCKFYHAKDEAIAFIVGSSVKSDTAIDQKNAIYISDLLDEEQYFSILLVRGDPGRAIPSFVNTAKREVTTVATDDPGAVPGASCHLVISKQEIAQGTDQGRYRMAMEQATGISRILARDFLGALLTKYSEAHPQHFTTEKKKKKKGEKAEVVQYRPTVRFHPHLNANLKDDLKKGNIGGFKLVRGTTEFTGEASAPKLQKLDVELHARIVPTKNFSQVRALVDHITQTLGNIDFENLKLELIDDDGEPMTNPHAIKLDSANEGDMRYCKKLSVSGLTGTEAECYSRFHDGILGFCKKSLSRNEHWN